MIKNTDAPTFEDIIKMMSSGENLPNRVGGGASDVERASEGARLADLIAEDPDKIRIICIACEGAVPLRLGTACVCGGWVCPACVALEGEGECTHERPAFIPDDDDD